MMNGASIVSLIPVGAKNAISMKNLSEKSGVSDRQVRRLIKNARFDGIEIIGDSNGYYLPETQEERRRFYNTFHKRGVCSLGSVSRSYAILKEEDENIPGQMNLYDYIPAGSGQKEETELLNNE